jgi:hypothetical protein
MYDLLMQRYHVYEWDIKLATENFVEENLAWIAGEADAEESRRKSGVKPGEEDIRVQARNAGLLMPEHHPPDT